MQYKYQETLLTHWLPNELIEAQKRGELLIFCGAGVSMKEDLPSFSQLTNDIAKEVFNVECKKINTNVGECIDMCSGLLSKSPWLTFIGNIWLNLIDAENIKAQIN